MLHEGGSGQSGQDIRPPYVTGKGDGSGHASHQAEPLGKSDSSGHASCQAEPLVGKGKQDWRVPLVSCLQDLGSVKDRKLRRQVLKYMWLNEELYRRTVDGM